MDKNGKEIIAVCNFQPVKRVKYRIGAPTSGVYAEIFNSEAEKFGGCGVTNGNHIESENIPMHGYEQSVSLTLPPMSVLYLTCTEEKPKKKASAEAKSQSATKKIN